VGELVYLHFIDQWFWGGNIDTYVPQVIAMMGNPELEAVWLSRRVG
jgi:hypothetical protein